MEENIVLVFDEITAGFRLCAGGSHKVLGVEPDMAIFAKAMTNGYPVSAVIGREEVMQTVKRLNSELGITIVLVTHFMDEAVQADRVIVVDSGRLVMDGKPKEVFSKVEKLRSFGLDVPQSTELCHVLGIKEGVIGIDECVDEISKYLGGAR